MKELAPRTARPTLLYLTLLICAALLVVASVSAQEAPTDAELLSVNPALVEPHLVDVKFQEGPRIRLRNGQPTDVSAGPSARQPLAALGVLPDATWTRTHRLDEATLDRMHAQGTARSGRPVPDLNHWYRLQLPPDVSVAQAIAALRALPEIEQAIPVPKPAPPPLPPDYSGPNDDNFDDDPSLNRHIYQRYLDAAPEGLDFRFAWNGDGGAGEDIAICDVEYGWNADHADLPPVTLLGDDPDPGNPDSWFEHGTAVLGQLGALDNGWGTTGMAHDATFYFAAADTEAGGYNVASAVSTCANELNPGDIILIEQQISGPNATGSGQIGLVPVEWNEGIYDAIVAAVAQGIIVVEAGGNGSQNLDDTVYQTGNGGHHPFKPENDSGAIIVGSANSPYTASPRTRLSSSNYGQTVDLHGWGRDIVTTGYGRYYDDEGKDLWFTHAFGGTSGASPMVTAAAAIVQNSYLLKNGSAASPAAVLSLLKESGTPYNGNDHIGPQPDLKAAIEQVWDIARPAAPTITPPAGNYDMPITAVVDYGDAGQDWNNTALRYTLNGSDPTPDDYIYIPEQDSGVYLLYGVTMKARAYQFHPPAGRSFESDATTVIYTSTTPRVATPTISPGAGAYQQPHQVTITTVTPGATIRYRTDGRAPSLFYPGTVYNGPITLPPGTHNIAARAYRDGYYNSEAVYSGEVIVAPTTLPTPEIYPDGGTFAGQVTVHLQSTVAGADIRYTLDGATPTSSSPIYSSPFALTSSATVKARAFFTGYTPSVTASAEFEIVEQPPAPVITPNGGVFNGQAQVTISSNTPGAVIRYTDNGSEPASFSPLYEGPIVLGAGQHTVRAKAFLEGSTPSATSSASFTVYESEDGTVENATMRPFSTRYFVEPFTVTMHTDTAGATIYYTLQDGSLPPDPTQANTPYSGPFTISTNGNWYIKMRAFKDGSTPSGVVQSGMLSLGPPSGTTNAPVITPNGGVFTNTVQVTLSSPDGFETFFYTLDGSDPVTGPPVTLPSRQYNAPFNLSSPTTVRAQAYRPFFASGPVTAADFLFVCDRPQINATIDAQTAQATITMSTGTTNARITYTVDGSEPTENDNEYAAPFTLGAGDHAVKARCFRNTFQPSATALSVVQVPAQPVAPTISQQPTAQTVSLGETVTFTVAADGDPAPTYQWQRDGVSLAGQTEPELTLAAVRAADAGIYRVIVRNSAGQVFSAEVLLTVTGVPVDDNFENYLPYFVR